MKINRVSDRLLKKVVVASLRRDANSTTCSTIYQPKAPAELKQFSKIENDK